jgi:hypothetical protein
VAILGLIIFFWHATRKPSPPFPCSSLYSTSSHVPLPHTHKTAEEQGKSDPQKPSYVSTLRGEGKSSGGQILVWGDLRRRAQRTSDNTNKCLRICTTGSCHSYFFWAGFLAAMKVKITCSNDQIQSLLFRKYSYITKLVKVNVDCVLRVRSSYLLSVWRCPLVQAVIPARWCIDFRRQRVVSGLWRLWPRARGRSKVAKLTTTGAVLKPY